MNLYPFLTLWQSVTEFCILENKTNGITVLSFLYNKNFHNIYIGQHREKKSNILFLSSLLMIKNSVQILKILTIQIWNLDILNYNPTLNLVFLCSIKGKILQYI